MKRKFIKILVGVIILSLFWFFFIKKYDYQINFTVKTSPGTVFSNILGLESWTHPKKAKNIKVIDKTAFKNITQEIKFKDSIYEFNWNIIPVNDSVTKVKVFIKDKKHSVKQRLLLLVGKSKFIKKSIKFVDKINIELLEHLEKFRVKIIGKSQRPAYQSVIYLTFSTDLPAKAHNMIENVIFLTQYMSKHHIKKTGNPFIDITHWDVQKNTMTCEFGFPVENRSVYPEDSIVKVRHNLKALPALKAVFHGNYRFSDRAWFALYNYAKQHNIKVNNKPFETYLNDPHNGGTELDWQADVYLPLKEDKKK